MTAQELFELMDIGSLTRQVFAERDLITLDSFNLVKYVIPENYKVEELQISVEESTQYGKVIRRFLEPIIEKVEENGFNHNIFTALYEAVLNAYQHGNKKDPHKKITLACSIEDDKIEFAIIDQGGEIDSTFIPFILKHRQVDHEKRFINFYKFSGRAQHATNNGTGTSFMHTYVDKVGYFASEENGLVVTLTKYKEKQE